MSDELTTLCAEQRAKIAELQRQVDRNSRENRSLRADRDHLKGMIEQLARCILEIDAPIYDGEGAVDVAIRMLLGYKNPECSGGRRRVDYLGRKPRRVMVGSVVVDGLTFEWRYHRN